MDFSCHVDPPCGAGRPEPAASPGIRRRPSAIGRWPRASAGRPRRSVRQSRAGPPVFRGKSAAGPRSAGLRSGAADRAPPRRLAGSAGGIERWLRGASGGTRFEVSGARRWSAGKCPRTWTQCPLFRTPGFAAGGRSRVRLGAGAGPNGRGRGLDGSGGIAGRSAGSRAGRCHRRAGSVRGREDQLGCAGGSGAGAAESGRVSCRLGGPAAP